ncbi:uncharacterized protein LOC123472230 isoform X1 [Daphnia magna]|nr:uncharacterized protein LOC123472230 isoform X1 [Daphnia magna]
MESKTCISTLSAEDLRLHLLSTNKLPAGIPEKLLVIVKGNYSQLTSHLKLFHGFLKTTGHSNRTLYCGNADCKAGFNSFAKYRDHVINCLVKDPQPDVRQVLPDVSFQHIEPGVTDFDVSDPLQQDSFHQANATADKTTQRLARFFLELRAKHNVSHSAIDFIAKNIDTIFKDVAQFCDLETNLTLTNIEKATSKLNSHQKRIRYFTSNMGDNDTVIIEYSKATFGYRQKEIKQTLTEPGLIMKEYPRFKDFQNGSLFQVEFQLLYPDAKNFEKVFKEKFLFKILALANKKNIDIPDCPDECLKAVFVLLKLTPSIVKLRKVNFRLITERLIVFLKDNADLIQLSETRDPHLKQPFICCMGTMETPTNFWIVIDRDIILCGNDFATAFVNLFFSFYAFNLNFPQYLESFYGFFEECVFDIKIPSPSVTAFRASLECLRDLQG